MNERGVVEAALFSAGRVVSVEELAAATKLPEDRVRKALAELEAAYEGFGSAIEVARIGDRWTMQICSDYTERAEAFAPPEVPREILKTLALIAYYQPLKQSDLFDMVGSKVYEHTQALEQMGLIGRRPSGRTFELTTTRHFIEVFGVRATDRDGIRRILADRAGVKSVDTVPAEPAGESDAARETAEATPALPATGAANG